MAKKTIQIFKGGWSNSHENRIAVNQRPADGHLKSATWEDHIRINKDTFRCGLPKLEVGDILQIHTTPTFGVIEALGIAVSVAEEGLKFKVVSSDPSVDLSKIVVNTYEYDDSAANFSATATDDTLDSIDDIGNVEAWYSGLTKADEHLRIGNPVAIGLEVVALPAEGVQWTFDIESRLHIRQPVRPPACMLCC